MKRNQLIDEWMEYYAWFFNIVQVTLFTGVWCFLYGGACYQLKWKIAGISVTGYATVVVGCIITALCFAKLYTWLAERLQAQRIKCFQVEETIIAQLMACLLPEIMFFIVTGMFLEPRGAAGIKAWEIMMIFFILEMFIIMVWCLHGKDYISKQWKPYRTLVVAGDAFASLFVEKMQELEDSMYQVQMYVTDDKEEEILRALIRMHDAIIFYAVREERAEMLISYCRKLDKRILCAAKNDTNPRHRMQIESIASEPFWHMERVQSKGYAGKRLFDCLAGGILCIVSIPLMILIGVVQRIQTGSVSERIVMNLQEGKEDICYRFTLKEAQNETQDDDSFEGFSRFLYVTGLYRLPELFAVLAGRMHLVGPIWTEETNNLLEDLPEIIPERKEKIRYGLLGYASLYCQDRWQQEQRRAINVWYLQEESIGLDITMLLLQCKKMIVLGVKVIKQRIVYKNRKMNTIHKQIAK